MSTDTLGTGDNYATDPQLRGIARMMRQSDMTVVELAARLRVSKSHLYGMLSGRHKMAYVYILAIRQVMLEHRLGKV